MDKPKEDQAHLLREQMDAINNNGKLFATEEQEDAHGQEDIDVLNLPPRSVVHDEKSSRVKWKVSYALIRLFAILFIIIVVLVLTFNYWGNYFFQFNNSSEAQANQVGESVQIVSRGNHLSDEVTRWFQLNDDNDQQTEITGRYYQTQDNDSLQSIIEMFYDDEQYLSLIKRINNLNISTDALLEENRSLFLPNMVD
ncbi:hypothetical protein [Amphibacillus cookii]|uniref:hypothetical protein n=1 Tax=Amphibacillus cookii TaxID=767787 RepID=UPI00195D32EB|nr:hypothetical protein [Amphibacillus cookii]MBM7542496.1 hypothetical protein [Amphibacillus cookii]